MRRHLPPRPFARSLAVLCLILGLVAPSATLADRALVIGINAYERDPHIPPLAGAVADAQRMASYLTADGGYTEEQVLLLIDGAATRAAILSAIEEWLIAGTQPGERALLFFAGHGSHVRSQTAPSARDQVLVPFDSHFNDDAELQDFVRDKELGALLDRLNDRQVTVIVDSCYSGSITRSAGATDPVARMRTFRHPAAAPAGSASRSAGVPEPGAVLIESRPGRTVWSAASATQPAWETERDGAFSGVFTTAFLDGLEGAADADGNAAAVTHLALHDWLLDASLRACDTISDCLSLTPTLEVARSLQIAPVVTSLAGSPPPSAPGTAELATSALAPPAAAAPTPDAATAQAAEVVLRIEPDGPLLEGNRVSFIAEAGFDGYLTLLDINPRGEMTQLFPNRFSVAAAEVFGAGGNRIRSGRPIRLPDTTYGFAFTVQPPLGDGVLVAVVTADPVDLSDLAPASRSLILTGPDLSADWLLQLRDRLRRPIMDPEGFERQPRYAIGTLAYRTRSR